MLLQNYYNYNYFLNNIELEYLKQTTTTNLEFSHFHEFLHHVLFQTVYEYKYVLYTTTVCLIILQMKSFGM